jgi:hypothetical protein
MPALSTQPGQVDCPVPFGQLLYWWRRYGSYPFNDLIKESRRYEAPFLSWEEVRKIRNPFFDEGTGFEGYFVGVCPGAEAALEAVIAANRAILRNIQRDFRLDYGFRNRMMRTLTGEISDPKAMYVWAAELGAAIARMRCNLQRNPEGDSFRIETYRIVRSLPEIRYQEDDTTIEQSYWLGSRRPYQRITVSLDTLNPTDQDAWLVATSIGRFGHPLLRIYLRHYRH